MIITKILKKYFRKYIEYVSEIDQRNYILLIMNKNHISHNKVLGEDAFMEMWGVFNCKIDPIYYRCFSKYVGLNPNILSGNLCVNYIEPILNPLRYRDYYEDKNVLDKLYPNKWMPLTYFRKINGIFMDANYNLINFNENEILEFLKDVDKFVLKPSVDSCSGNRVLLFHKENNIFYDQNGSVFSLNTLSSYGENFILQSCVNQSDYLSQFNDSSINTLRLLVYRSVKDNRLHVTNQILRIGARNSVVDNAHAGGVFCGLNKEGVLNSYVGNSYGEMFEAFNGINFKKNQYIIPNYNIVKKFAIDVAKRIPHHRLIALDIALDNTNQPILIEYNIMGFGYWVFQLAGQITLDGFSKEIIEFCSQQKEFPKILYGI